MQNVVYTTPDATVQGWINAAKANGTWLILVYHEVYGADIGGDIYHADTAVLDTHMAAVKNSGLAMVTVHPSIEALTSPTTPPPTTPPPTTPPPTTPPPTTTPPPAEATTAINAVAAANPGLGTPSGEIVCGLVSGGCYRNYATGAVIWSPATGAHYSVGAIRQTWAATGFERGGLGYPTSNEVGGLVNGGVYQSIRVVPLFGPLLREHATLSVPSAQVWAATGFERGGLGYPTSNEVGGLVKRDIYQNYQGGAIVWSPATGAHYSVGAIRQVMGCNGLEAEGRPWVPDLQ